MRSLAVVAALASCSAVAGCASADASDVPEEDDAALTSALTGTLAAGTKLKTTANLNFRSSPEISTNVLRVVPKGTELLAVGGDAQNGFYAVTHGGRTGFASAKHLALATAASPSSGTSAGGTPSAGPASADFRVTYIGDSHSDYGGNAHASFGFLGEHVVERMTASGIPISLFAASASSPNWWFDDTPTQAATWGYTQTSPTPPRRSCSRGGQSGPCVPKLSAILSDHPSLFVIEQGTNDGVDARKVAQRAVERVNDGARRDAIPGRPQPLLPGRRGVEPALLAERLEDRAEQAVEACAELAPPADDLGGRRRGVAVARELAVDALAQREEVQRERAGGDAGG